MRSVRPASGVKHRVARLQLAGINANKSQLADERISHDLESQSGKRLVIRRLAGNHFAVVRIRAFHFAGIERRRQIIHHRIEQRLYTLVLESGADHNRKQFQVNRRLAQRSPQFLGGNGLAFEELVQDLVVVFSDSLDQLRVEGFGFLLQLGRNFAGNVLGADRVVLPDDRLHLDEIDHAFELVFLADGNLDRDGLGVEALADGIDGMLEVRAHLVDLVNEANSRHAVLIGLTPDFFRLRLHAVDRVEHRHRAVQHAQRALDFSGEIHVAGGINNVDANVAPGAGGRGGSNGDAALLLLLHPVHGGRAFVDLSDAVRLSRIEKDALRRSGLTGIDVGHDADVPAPF